MRLVVWHCDAYPTAPGVYLGCFPRAGHEVTWVVAGRGPRNAVRHSSEGRVRTFVVELRHDSALPRPFGTVVNRWNKLLLFFRKAGLMDRLARERPDVLQVRELIVEGVLAAWAARRHGVRFAFQFDYPHVEGRLHELDRRGEVRPLERALLAWLAWLRRRMLRRADLVFPLTEALAEVLRDRDGVDPAKMVPFPVGVSADTLRRGGEAGVNPRVADLAGLPTVCYLGNLHFLRDPQLLFRVLAEIARRVPESRFLVVGESNPEADAVMRAFPARDRLRFTGPVPHEEVPSVLRAAVVGVFPLPTDDPYRIFTTSSPLKVVEYLSAGLPVVASRVRDAERLLAASGGGVCVDNDPPVFAAAVEAYLRDPERARRDGERGRAYVAAHRVFDALAREVEAAYRRLLETGVPAAPGGPPAGLENTRS